MKFGEDWVEPTPHYSRYLEDKGLEAPEVLEAFYGDNPAQPVHEIHALQSGSLENSFECMVSDFAVDLMRQFAGEEKPFFLWANFWGPHTPCLVPEPYYSMYDPTEIPQPPSFTETWERKPRVQELYERFWGLSGGGWESWRETVARYWGYVTMIDDLVGRMLEELRTLGLADDTLVVFTTDHGDMMGAHRLIEKGPFTYEQCYRLPMVAADPDCEDPGTACDEFVYLHDLFPTFLEMAGADLPDVPDSRSIRSNVLGREAPTGRDSIYSAFDSQIFPFPQRMVRTRRHKLVYNVSDIGELYDLGSDPWEMRNLIDLPETADIQNELLERMHEHMVRLDDPMLDRFEKIRPVY
jgi:arylsulfatase A-like enzyme